MMKIRKLFILITNKIHSVILQVGPEEGSVYAALNPTLSPPPHAPLRTLGGERLFPLDPQPKEKHFKEGSTKK